MPKKLDWLSAMVAINLKSARAGRGHFLTMSSFMALNNLIFFGVWLTFFHVTGPVKGWTAPDIAVLFGMGAYSFGIGFTLCGGAWRMAKPILDGALDTHLGRPSPVLPGMILSRIDPSAGGDIASGLILMIGFGHLDAAHAAGAAALGLLAASVTVATAIMISSLVFWTGNGGGLSDQLLDAFIGFSTMPLNGLPGLVKILLFTALPAGFVTFLPATILRAFSWPALAAMVAAAVVFPLLAAWMFERGLRRYTSGNRMAEIR